jgi:hypothetical protein
MSQLGYVARNSGATQRKVAVAAWLAAGAAILGSVLVIALLAWDSDENSTPATQANTPQTRFDGGPNEGTRGAVTRASSPTTRFDGGPQEGSRGEIVSQTSYVPVVKSFDRGPRAGSIGEPPSRATGLAAHVPLRPSQAPSVRFDGGPNEGSRGTVTSQSSQSLSSRFDGGPNEGSRGSVTSQSSQSPSSRFDGGPNEGTRGR